MVRVTQWVSILFLTVVIGNDNLGKAIFPLPAVCESVDMDNKLLQQILVTILCNSYILLYKAKDMQHKKRTKYQYNV